MRECLEVLTEKKTLLLPEIGPQSSTPYIVSKLSYHDLILLVG
jgi:hypothetical protein